MNGKHLYDLFSGVYRGIQGRGLRVEAFSVYDFELPDVCMPLSLIDMLLIALNREP